jgi:hypothetical protein
MKKFWNEITRNYLSDVKHDYTIVRLETNSIGKQIAVISQLLLNAIIVPPKIFVKAFIQELFLLIISIFKTLFVTFVFPLGLLFLYWGMVISVIIEYLKFNWQHRKNDN